MNKTTSFVELGDQQLDRNQFAAARSSYRQALLSGADSIHVIHNLHLAEKEERDEFWRSVVDRFPESRPLRIARIEWRLRGGFAALAFLECTDLLGSVNFRKEAPLLRFARLRAAAPGRNFEKFSEDFKSVWGADHSDSAGEALRPGLLSIIAELSTVDAIPALEDLILEFQLQRAVVDFLSAKRSELIALVKLKEEVRAKRAGDL